MKKYYKNMLNNYEVNDTSGLKTLQQIRNEFNDQNLEDITIQRESEIEAAKQQSIINKQAIEANEAAKQQAIVDNLPTWQQISDAIDNADNLIKLRTIVKKIARITYWLAKNKPD